MATTITCVITNNDAVNAIQYHIHPGNPAGTMPSADGRTGGVTIGTIAASPGNASLTLSHTDTLTFSPVVRPRNKYPT